MSKIPIPKPTFKTHRSDRGDSDDSEDGDDDGDVSEAGVGAINCAGDVDDNDGNADADGGIGGGGSGDGGGSCGRHVAVADNDEDFPGGDLAPCVSGVRVTPAVASLGQRARLACRGLWLCWATRRTSSGLR